jgi:hypothetical protein
MARLTKKEWDLIQVEFESGKSNSEIARNYDITEGAIRQRAIKDNWNKDLRENISQVVDSYRGLNQTTRNYEVEQKNKVSDIIKEELSYIGVLNDITKIVLKAHKNLAISTVNKLAKGEYQPHQGAAVFQMQGLNVPNLAKIAGIESIKDLDRKNNEDKISINIIGQN